MVWTSSYWLHDALEWADYIMQQNVSYLTYYVMQWCGPVLTDYMMH